MKVNPLKDSNKEDLSNLMEIDNKKATCKDGFCFIPNQNENKPISNENINIFDPL